jgi:hypothetical protein
VEKSITKEVAETRSVVSALFENGPPILVEVRFPGAGTSVDWHLYEEEDELDKLLDTLAPGVELRLSSVWDLKNTKREVSFKK